MIFFFFISVRTIHSSNVIVQVAAENTALLPFKPQDAHICRS